MAFYDLSRHAVESTAQSDNKVGTLLWESNFRLLIYLFTIFPSSDHVECHQRVPQSDHVPTGEHEVQGKSRFVTLVVKLLPIALLHKHLNR